MNISTCTSGTGRGDVGGPPPSTSDWARASVIAAGWHATKMLLRRDVPL